MKCQPFSFFFQVLMDFGKINHRQSRAVEVFSLDMWMHRDFQSSLTKKEVEGNLAFNP